MCVYDIIKLHINLQGWSRMFLTHWLCLTLGSHYQEECRALTTRRMYFIIHVYWSKFRKSCFTFFTSNYFTHHIFTSNYFTSNYFFTSKIMVSWIILPIIRFCDSLSVQGTCHVAAIKDGKGPIGMRTHISIHTQITSILMRYKSYTNNNLQNMLCIYIYC